MSYLYLQSCFCEVQRVGHKLGHECGQYRQGILFRPTKLQGGKYIIFIYKKKINITNSKNKLLHKKHIHTTTHQKITQTNIQPHTHTHTNILGPK